MANEKDMTEEKKNSKPLLKNTASRVWKKRKKFALPKVLT